MNNHIEYLGFKGVEKKEQILFKSFLNLAKNDLSYQVIVLKAKDEEEHAPTILIVDESYSLEEDVADLTGVQHILVGNDPEKQSDSYIVRPVQWSDFKAALGKLVIDGVETPVEERLLPEDVDLEVEESLSPDTEASSHSELLDADEQSESTLIDVYSGDDVYESYELDQLSAQYGEVTNDEEYMQVVDDVIQYNTEKSAELQESPESPESPDDVIQYNTEKSQDSQDDTAAEPFILVSDDESASANSVLVIETNSMDAWDFNELEMQADVASEETSNSFSKFKKAMGVDDEDTEDVSELDIPKRTGNRIGLDEEYWFERNEIIADGESFLYFLPDRKMVYSSKEPGMWPSVLKRYRLTKSMIADDWKPEPELTAYPLDTFRWTHILVTETTELSNSLDDEGEYMLESWPSFELLELDNILLKLCAMLFVRPESMASLAQKSGYGLSTVCGLMNACHEFGLLKEPSQISSDITINDDVGEGMLGKIRDAFSR